MSGAFRCIICKGANLLIYKLDQTIPDTQTRTTLSMMKCRDCLVEAPIHTWALASALQDRAPVQEWHYKATQWLLKKVADDKVSFATGKPGSGLDEKTLRYLINELNSISSKYWKDWRK